MAGMPPLPLAKAELTGAAAKNPQRYRDRSEPEPAGPVGDPPASLNKTEKAAWRTFVAELPWLTAGDRAVLTAACKLRAQIEQPGYSLSGSMMTSYRQALSELGATPTSRQRVTQPKPDEGDPFAAFDA